MKSKGSISTNQSLTDFTVARCITEYQNTASLRGTVARLYLLRSDLLSSNKTGISQQVTDFMAVWPNASTITPAFSLAPETQLSPLFEH